MQKVFTIPDMMCNNCVMHLETMEDELPGVKGARASLGKHTLAVDFDENKVSESQLKKWIGQKGYSISEAETLTGC